MSKPTLQQWRSNNPNKSINEYYKSYPEKRIVDQNSISSSFFNQPLIQMYQFHTDTNEALHPYYINELKKKESVNIGDVFFSIIAVVSFFLPWLKINFFGLYNITEATGLDIPGILRLIGYQIPEITLKSFYAMPICAGIILIGELGKMWLVKIAGAVGFVTLSVLWMCVLYHLTSSSNYGIDLGLRTVSDIGLYMLVGASVYFILREIYELFR